MSKDFDNWNKLKKKTNHLSNLPYFKQQEVWWTRAGLNIGIESNGKGQEFTRPALILKKHNQYSCLVVFLTTHNTSSKSSMCIDPQNHPDAFVKLSQIKTVDSKRLVRKMFFLNQNSFEHIKSNIRIFNEL